MLNVSRIKFRRALPFIVILSLVMLNYFGYRITKNYISKSNYEEVEELTDSDNARYKNSRIIGWTYEYFKSFRNPNNK